MGCKMKFFQTLDQVVSICFALGIFFIIMKSISNSPISPDFFWKFVLIYCFYVFLHFIFKLFFVKIIKRSDHEV